MQDIVRVCIFIYLVFVGNARVINVKGHAKKVYRQDAVRGVP